MAKNKRGSVFLITVGILMVVLVFVAALSFLASNEDASSAVSYESEVAFELAESAVEEFMARIKTRFNNHSGKNDFYYALRTIKDENLNKEIPLEADEVARLVEVTKKMAEEHYDMRFGTKGAKDNELRVKASIVFQGIPQPFDFGLYKRPVDPVEKTGLLVVKALANFKGYKSLVKLSCKIVVAKTFVPPFNYFTLFVHNASLRDYSDGTGKEGSFFNAALRNPKSLNPTAHLVLDNGWRFLKRDFNYIQDRDYWEDVLSRYKPADAVFPPGRVYLGYPETDDIKNAMKSEGKKPEELASAAVMIQAMSNLGKKNVCANSPDNYYFDEMFFRPDMPFVGFKDYVEGERKWYQSIKDWGYNLLKGISMDNKTKIKKVYVGATDDLVDEVLGSSAPFTEYFLGYKKLREYSISSRAERPIDKKEMPELNLGGFHPFGANFDETDKDLQKPTKNNRVSPTLIYGKANIQYYQAVEIQTKSNKKVSAPFMGWGLKDKKTWDDPADNAVLEKLASKFDAATYKLSASEARILFKNSGLIEPRHSNPKILDVWDELPDAMKSLRFYPNDEKQRFMSMPVSHLYNESLINMSQRAIGSNDGSYDGKLKNIVTAPLENSDKNDIIWDDWKQLKKDDKEILDNQPMRRFYEGPLHNAMALPGSPSALANNVLFDTFFNPRVTEDFFRGRKTIPIGGRQYDRFIYKYINRPQEYLSGARGLILNLNGILSLNDPPGDDLVLRNLKFKGHGIIWISPIMTQNGGKVVIKGDLLAVNSTGPTLDIDEQRENLLTIVAPSIEIDTDVSPDNRCYVEANLISLCSPLKVTGNKPITIKGQVVTTSLDLTRDMPKSGNKDNIIIYNSLNTKWLNDSDPNLYPSMYVAKIVTGGIAKDHFKWNSQNGSLVEENDF